MNEAIPWWIEKTPIQLWNLNPPHFHLLLLPLTWFENDVALAVWFVPNFACLLVGLKLVVAELGIDWTRLQQQLAVLGVLAFVGTTTALATGHMSFLLFLLLTLAWRAARRGRWTRSAVALALALSLKPFLLLLAPYYAWRRQWRACAVLVVVVAACYLAGLLVFGIENHWSWLGRLATAESWAWLPMNASLMGLLTRTFTANPWYGSAGQFAPETIKLIWLALGIPCGLLTLAAVAPDASRRGVDRAFGLLLVGSLLLSPLGWTYYFPLAVGPIAILAVTWTRERGADGNRWTWRQRLLAAAIPGYCAPVFVGAVGQPQPLMTAIFGSIYFWSLLLTWVALTLDGLAAVGGQPLAAGRQAPNGEPNLFFRRQGVIP